MRLASKHANQQAVAYTDFSGGINTTVAQEMIAPNELADVLNMEIDRATGLLRTADGCRRVYAPAGISLRAMLYDNINQLFLLVGADKKVYTSDLTSHTEVGALAGDLFPVYTAWEDGVLIASGGKLQYWDGKTLNTLATSPEACGFVYIRGGRVMVAEENNIHYSAVGDEGDWTDDSNVDSSSKFVEAGYKDGGKILALASMAQDVMIIKDNRRVYRLTGEYPNWAIYEVSRNADCIGRLGWYAAGGEIFLLGRSEIIALSTNNYYGDIRAQDIAGKVARKLADVAPDNPRMIYVPPLNQVWMPMLQRYVLVLDCNTRSFFMRRFEHEDIVDVVCAGKDVYVARPNSICKLQRNLFEDDGEAMIWKFTAKRMVSNNDFLLKRAQVNITPFFDRLVEGNFRVGAVMLPLPTPYVAYRVWHNESRLYHNRRHVCGANERAYNLYDTGAAVYENYDRLWHNYAPVYNPAALAMGMRAVSRNKTITVSGNGRGGSFLLNTIHFEAAEV